ncbi:hypothetical protein Bbelb_193970 [Branchiostoma belcheri]|nr:hypothetical protein Bbelb_193970 [Branchiostoma belcheri]
MSYMEHVPAKARAGSRRFVWLSTHLNSSCTKPDCAPTRPEPVSMKQWSNVLTEQQLKRLTVLLINGDVQYVSLGLSKKGGEQYRAEERSGDKAFTDGFQAMMTEQ